MARLHVGEHIRDSCEGYTRRKRICHYHTTSFCNFQFFRFCLYMFRYNRSMKSDVFYTISISFLIGVFIRSCTELSAYVSVLIFFVWFSLCFILFVSDISLRYVGLCILSFVSLWMGICVFEWRTFTSEDSSYEVSIVQEFTGILCDEPRFKDTTLQFCFDPDGAGARFLVTTDRYPEYRYGDRLVIRGALQKPKNFESYEGGPIFNYVSYLAKDGVAYIMAFPEITHISSHHGSGVLEVLFSIKSAFLSTMQMLLPEPESSVLGGILLGTRHSISRDLTEDFRKVGLIHILVLSGYNVTIVAESLMKLSAFLPRVWGRMFGASSIILFTIMTGASTTTVRASIMALIVIFARSFARRYDVGRALVLAALVMVIHNPLILVFDVSFQLSFIATIGLVYVSPLVQDKLLFVTEKFALRDIIATTLGTQLFITPFLIHTMGEVSLVSLISNILVLPIIPYLMMIGFTAVMIGFVLHMIALPFAWITELILKYMLYITEIFASIPFASIRIQTSIEILVCIYGMYAIILIYLWRQKNSSLHSPN